MRLWNVVGIALATLSFFSGVGCMADGSHRSLETRRDGRWAGYGVSYGPFRAGQSPNTDSKPTVEQLREDLHILDQHFDLIRIYGSDEGSERILKIIREDGLGLRVLVGAWLGHDMATQSMLDGAEGPAEGETEWFPDEETRAENAKQVEEAVRLANEYPDVTWAVNIGNETQVWWTGHKVTTDRLIEHLRWARERTSVPVTTADDYNFWNKPESVRVAAECDFIALHTYAMWNEQTLDTAMDWTREQYGQIRGLHPGVPIVITEAGWATSKINTGLQAQLIKGQAGVEQQTAFTEAFLAWASEEKIPHFLFEAFDEPWKGGDDPAEVEKNWGLWYESRAPKPAAVWLEQHGPRARLLRAD